MNLVIGIFLLNGPLVVLGEPGAGKSEIVKQLNPGTDVICYSASSVLSFPALPLHDYNARVVIDGFDEITAYSGGTPVIQILSKKNLPRLRKIKVLTFYRPDLRELFAASGAQYT